MISKTNKDKIKSKTHAPDSVPSFIRKTYDILEERKFPEVIDWNPEGTALVIKKPSEFCQKVLPAYFKHNNLTSFVRQLNMYNFHKRRTQNIDHVYYHELFQKGKKHLLKDIKRKNHDHTTDKAQKLPDSLDSSPNGKDFSSVVYENQFLKRLYNDAMTKVNMLESQMKDLTLQNQSLWTQLCQHSERENAMKPLLAKFGKQTSELTQDQLPMTFGEVSIPPLKLTLERQVSNQSTHTFIKAPLNVNHFFNLGEENSGDSTEVSHNSPSLQPSMESDKCFDLSDSTSLYASGQPIQIPQYSQGSLAPQVYQIQFPKANNDLHISKQEMSVGQLFENWNYENQNNEMLCFADPKGEKQTTLPQLVYQDASSVLGKRPLEIENQGNQFNISEPLMKRPHELSIFNRKAMISTGTEDKEILRTLLRRDSSVIEEYDTNVAVDLMDFNQSYYGWPKAV
jgi:hypothetical protein